TTCFPSRPSRWAWPGPARTNSIRPGARPPDAMVARHSVADLSRKEPRRSRGPPQERPPMTRVNINGQLVDKNDAKINVYDHGLLYGDGVFEGIRIYAGKVFRLHEHIERLYESARHIGLDIPWSPQKMIEEVQRTVEANQKKEGYI